MIPCQLLCSLRSVRISHLSHIHVADWEPGLKINMHAATQLPASPLLSIMDDGVTSSIRGRPLLPHIESFLCHARVERCSYATFFLCLFEADKQMDRQAGRQAGQRQPPCSLLNTHKCTHKHPSSSSTLDEHTQAITSASLPTTTAL